MKNLRQFISQYKHGFIPILYGIFYFTVFIYLENRPVESFHMLHSPIDDCIPFCEYFIIPYYLWFPYIAVAVAAFVFLDKEKKEFTKLCIMLGIGMTLFLIVSYGYPNAIALRPDHFDRSNVFTWLTQRIYTSDTSTNVFPSIHCFNSFAVCAAIWHNKQARRHIWIPALATILSLLIVLSTMFVKQHSCIDVVGALILFIILYVPIYLLPGIKTARYD